MCVLNNVRARARVLCCDCDVYIESWYARVRVSVA